MKEANWMLEFFWPVSSMIMLNVYLMPCRVAIFPVEDLCTIIYHGWQRIPLLDTNQCWLGECMLPSSLYIMNRLWWLVYATECIVSEYIGSG